MPVLSLHNTYTLPSGSASYTLGLSGAPGAASYTLPSMGTAASTGLSNMLGGTSSSALTSGLLGGTGTGLSGLGGGLTGTGGLSGYSTSGLGGLSGLTGTGLSNTLPLSLGLGTNTSYTTFTNPLLTSGVSSKLRALDDLDLSLARHRVGSPLSPLIAPGVTGWDLDRYGLEGICPTYLHSQSRPLSRIGILDNLDSKYRPIIVS